MQRHGVVIRVALEAGILNNIIGARSIITNFPPLEETESRKRRASRF